MKWIYIPIVVVLLSAYTALNYYIGIRGAQAFGTLMGLRGLRAGWIVFWILVYLYMATRLLQDFIPSPLDRWLIHAGSYWMAAMVYFLIFLSFIDLGRLLMVTASMDPADWPGLKPFLGLLILTAVTGLLVIGTWNARNPRVVHYQVNLTPDRGGETAATVIRVALVSDIHLGTIIRNNRLETLVNQLQELNPDLVLFAGDIIDENVNHFIDERMDKTLQVLQPPLGKYAVLGNHEYFGGHLDDIVLHLHNAGIRVLRDEGLMIADTFYLAGREDVVSERFLNKPRHSLEDLLEEVDPLQVPVVLMDHQPKTWSDARNFGVRLQVSGHTHKGQLFPFGWITKRLFDEDWGELNQNGQVLIVSSGYGTWGPPVRTGNRPEIVMMTLVAGEASTN